MSASAKVDEDDDEAERQLQHDLAGVVKGVHDNLRKKLNEASRHEADVACVTGDDDAVWDSVWSGHCDDRDQLGNYSRAMRDLACSVWKGRGQSRLMWCVDTCKEYFDADGGLCQALRKEHKRRHKECDHSLRQIDEEEWQVQVAGLSPPCSCDVHTTWYQCGQIHGGIRLLDVGSCYNPFSQFDGFVPTAIDLCPAEESTYECDFTRLAVTSAAACWSQLPALTSPVRQLPRHAYHCVVFCLLLSYLPSARQRWRCCVKAFELLAPNGLLVITTPDSSHAGRRAQLMKSWRIAIEAIGFKRWRYEKLEHLHCMAFRRLPPGDDEACRAGWRSASAATSSSRPMHDDAGVAAARGSPPAACLCALCAGPPVDGSLAIPQDSSAFSGESAAQSDVYLCLEPRTDEQDTELAECFDELPGGESD